MVLAKAREKIKGVVVVHPRNKKNLEMEKLDQLLQQEEGADPIILSVGGGNSETILDVKDNIIIGNKHIAEVAERFGGSGVNHTIRLTSAGYDVFPVLTIGCDEIGKKIQKELIKTAKTHNSSKKVLSFIGDNEDAEAFFDPNIQTSSTTIIVHGAKRTIFTQKLRNGRHFIRHVKRRLDKFSELSTILPTVVLIGHIQSDGKDINQQNPGECTNYLIQKFHEQSIIYTVLGNSQIKLGFNFWLDVLPKIDIFQLNLEEAKRFFSEDLGNNASLQKIVERIRNLNLTAIITLDRFGAIGIHKELSDSVILAWPVVDVHKVIDPTGAGDASAAGVVSYLSERPKFSPSDFQSAINVARVWAAYACRTKGGSGDSPTQRDLINFQTELNKDGIGDCQQRCRLI